MFQIKRSAATSGRYSLLCIYSTRVILQETRNSMLPMNEIRSLWQPSMYIINISISEFLIHCHWKLIGISFLWILTFFPFLFSSFHSFPDCLTMLLWLYYGCIQFLLYLSLFSSSLIVMSPTFFAPIRLNSLALCAEQTQQPQKPAQNSSCHC